MRAKFLGAMGMLILLAGCGSSEPDPVVEQIVVREPGAPATNVTNANNVAMADSGVAIVTDRVAAGQAAFQACLGCHVAQAGAASMAGPNLYGVVGRKAGALDDFAYSDALSTSGITWDYASLDRFLSNPSGYVPGTSMVAGAVRDGERRAAIVAYLESTSE